MDNYTKTVKLFLLRALYVAATVSLAYLDFFTSVSRGKHNIIAILVLGSFTTTPVLSAGHRSVSLLLYYFTGFGCVVVSRYWMQATGTADWAEMSFRSIGACLMLVAYFKIDWRQQIS